MTEAVHFFLLVLGVVLSLKKVAEMDRYDNLRIFVFTTILSLLVIYFFLEYGFTLGNSRFSQCVINFDDRQFF